MSLVLMEFHCEIKGVFIVFKVCLGFYLFKSTNPWTPKQELHTIAESMQSYFLVFPSSVTQGHLQIVSYEIHCTIIMATSF